ncbi:TlpA disulfide reductase family protein [Teredinibacter turnerae]|uniref:Thiol-disulfide isomerase and thioredoxins/Thiol-disulfide oxidoreductase resA n=1 Tax=Teredinibacter turnerae (strain ATCC 39867 / T7901) TaxID=377629 RepID=C5BTL8_TERTT|nr:TlpA disulfide reductase family protein [Teredinibacter turnerae]ACR12150.1 thiol-disulfide isomerase and thioredoxins/Thiol-disulfide oxidoreductase resA [Teredinibacter turnerae T7901]
MIRNRNWLATIALTFAAATCCIGLSGNALAKSAGGAAKDFTLKANNGKNVRLSDLRGQVVMLNFWASWCGPCRQEMPLLDALYKKYSPAGFTLLGVNVEADPKEADALLKELPVSFPVLYDTTSKVSEAYKVDAMPSSVLIDCDGKVSYIHKGYKPGDEKEYKKRVKELIRSCSM